MIRRRRETPRRPAASGWFLSDAAIQRAEDDLLDLASVAETLVEAIESATPPCMIGLVAGFGKGKSSTANLAARILEKRADFDVVTVTADKHSGSARARNLVHAIAGELVAHGHLTKRSVNRLVLSLRRSKHVTAGVSLRWYAFARVTKSIPRAEASDEIEEVFAKLIDRHRKKRERTLVVFVDDIDRLAAEDLLDALRTLRSLQSVPRDNEPVFVMSCDDIVVRRAVEAARRHPVGQIRAESAESAPDSAEHDAAAAFVDKLLTVRVSLPPRGPDDMRRFAVAVIAADHPLRTVSGVDIEQLMSILIHDRVDSPRTAVRLINRFLAAYRLAEVRERDFIVSAGALTDHFDVLAMLSVLSDEFHDFARQVADDPVLLSAAHKVALREGHLTDIENDALARSHDYEGGNDNRTADSYHCRPRALRLFLSGTARRVRMPADVAPFVYLAAIGSMDPRVRRHYPELLGAIRSGDPSELADLLEGDLGGDPDGVGVAISDIVRDAFDSDAATFVQAVAPNLFRLGTAAGAAVDACAALIGRDDIGATYPVGALTELICYASPRASEELVSELFAGSGDFDADNARVLAAAHSMLTRPLARTRIEPSVVDWIEQLPENGSWAAAQLWLDFVEAWHHALLDASANEPSKSNDIGTSESTEPPSSLARSSERMVVALIRSVRAESEIYRLDVDRLLALAERALQEGSPMPASDALIERGPNTERLLVSLWTLTSCTLTPADALLASEVAANATHDDELRRTAINLLSQQVERWGKSAPAGDDAEPLATNRNQLAQNLLTAVDHADTRLAVADNLRVFAVMGGMWELRTPVAETAAQLIREAPDDEAEAIARCAIEVAWFTDSPVEFRSYVGPLFTLADSDIDPEHPSALITLRLLHLAAQAEVSGELLEALAEKLRNGMLSETTTDSRTRVAAFQAINERDPQIVSRHSGFDGVVSARLTDPNRSEDAARTIAEFPWPPRARDGLLRTLNQDWDRIPPASRRVALAAIVGEAINSRTVAALHERIADEVAEDPAGPVGEIAAEEAPRMDQLTLKRVLADGVGRHDGLTAYWRAESDIERAAAVAAAAPDVETTHRLLNALSDPRRKRVAAAALRRMTTSEYDAEMSPRRAPLDPDQRAAGEAAAAAVAEHADFDGVVEAGDAAIDALNPNQQPQALYAGFVRDVAADRGAPRAIHHRERTSQ